jgi:crotonobetainyl-CoA:carnitine CoA-transferase CaiB-like acyl-CoA transferase
MSGALDGLVALDLATFIAAPFCCTLLGEHGAEVIKIEQPGIGDDLRRLGHKPADGMSYMWLVESRNKKSITCNLRAPEGQALITRLAAQADILAENFRPGTMEKWHLGYDELSRVNPRLVMVRISAFGQTGPSRERPGFGRIAGAVSGVSYVSGYPDRPPVSPGTPTIPDYLAGVMGAFGALAAIESRHQTGLGQMVDVALYEPMLRMMDEMIPVYGALGVIRERIGSGTEYVVPHNHYQARDGSWIAIACTNDRMFERLAVDAMKQPDLPAEFPTMAERLRRRAELDARVQAWVGSFDATEVLARLDGASVPCSRVNSVKDIFADEHMRARDNVITVPGPDGGALRMPGIVPKLSRTPGRITSAGPAKPGEHNEKLLRPPRAHPRRPGRAVEERHRMNAVERQMVLVAFLQAQNCSNYPASWRHAETATDFLSAEYFQRIARTLEDAKFHLAFFDDRLAMPDRYGDDYAESVRHGIRVVKMDLIPLMTAMGLATRRLGIGGTYSTTYAEPFHVARTFATLDHMIGGRAAWNIVTSLNDSEAANFGMEAHPEHDARYERATVREVVLGHWDTWEDDAIILDRARGIFADPAKVHRLDHRGKWFKSRGPFTVPRSPRAAPS